MEYLYTNLPRYVTVTPRSAFANSVVQSGHVLLFSEDGTTLTAKLPDGSFITVGGSGGIDVSDTTAEAGDVLEGKVFHDSAGSLTSGTIPVVSGGSVIVPGTAEQLIVSSGGAFVNGSLAVAGDTALVASNIMSGITIFGVAGTAEAGSGGTDVSDTTATPAMVLSGAVFHDSTGAVTTGTIPTVSAAITSGAVVVPSGYIAEPQSFPVSGGSEEDVTLGYVSGGVFYELAFSGTSSIEASSSSGLSAYGWNLPVSSGSSGSDQDPPEMVESGVVITSGGSVVSAGMSMENMILTKDMSIGESGTATNIVVNNSGKMAIYSGGTATACNVNSGGAVWLFDGGQMLSSTMINSGGSLYVSGGSAQVVSAYADVIDLYGGTIESIYFTGSANVYSGATAKHMYGWVGSAALITGYANIDGGTVISAHLTSLDVRNGGICGHCYANSANISSGGAVSSGVLQSAVIFDSGYINKTIITSGADIYGSAHDLTIGFGSNTASASAVIHSGGTASNTALFDSGALIISEGGTADGVFPAYSGSCGILHVLSGGAAYNVYNNASPINITVDPGGLITYAKATITSSAMSSSVVVSCATVINGAEISGSAFAMHIFSGGTANSTTVISGGSMGVGSGGTANETTVISSGKLHVYGGGTANSTTVNFAGSMYVSSGGTANETTINRGHLYVLSDSYGRGTANSTTVNDGGHLNVSPRGLARYITVNYGGTLHVSSGGTALAVTSMAGASVDVADGGYIEYVTSEP